MMEFMLTLAVVALVFVGATILVALMAGGLFRIKGLALKRESGNTGR